MADDREILREIWEGKIPVCFQLAQEEVFSGEQPDSFFLLVPRLSYFPLVSDKVQRHLVKHVDPEATGEMWLESQGQPLKWHYPIGVLFDLYGNQNDLPWKLTVHFKDFPEEELLHCPSKDAVQSHFISVVKEAEALKHRGQVINSMQKKDHSTLWAGFMNDKFDQFWSVNKRLMENSGDKSFMHVPFKIHRTDHLPVSKLFKPNSESGEAKTLRDLINTALPDHASLLKSSPSHSVVVQGIHVPLDSPVAWLSEHLSYPDNFLHICLVNTLDVES